MPFFCYNKDDYCDHSEDCGNCDVWVKGKGGKEVPSNADRIRAMTDEELAGFLCKVNGCYQANCPGAKLCKFGGGKANGLKQWLQQPAEEGTP